MSVISEKTLDSNIDDLKIEYLDMSYGEILSLIRESELIIDPDYQRYFRWSEEQQSRLIESILLRIPIPQLFVIELDDGKFELADGLQRVSTLIHFFGPTETSKEIFSKYNMNEPLVLNGCDILKDLNGKSCLTMELRSRLSIKRCPIRVVIVKKHSNEFFRYELFKRLNTGGSSLSDQEIRNCSARMIGEHGKNFYIFLQKCVNDNNFRKCISNLSDTAEEKKGDEELVLRFFALINYENFFKGSVRDWLDNYMEQVITGKMPFAYDGQEDRFLKVFEIVTLLFGDNAFVKYRENRPIGGLAPAYFEAVCGGIAKNLNMADEIKRKKEIIANAIIMTIQEEEFKKCTGPGANTKEKLNRRVEFVDKAIKGC